MRTIFFQKKSSKKTEINPDTGEKEYEIYDCRVRLDDEKKIIFWMDCPCWNFQNHRIQKVGKVQDIIYTAEPCKHLESVVNALKLQGYIIKEIKTMQGSDKCTPQLRRQILTIYKNTCSVEGCDETTNLEIHRRMPGVNGGKYSLSNCEPLCRKHHQLITFQKYRDLK